MRWVDPWGLLVTGIYDHQAKRLTLTDIDTGQTVSGPFDSGWITARPIPNGVYDILHYIGENSTHSTPYWYRLEPVDTNYGDDQVGIRNDKDNSEYRLHRPGRSTGCITSLDQEWANWYLITSFILGTKTDTVTVHSKSRLSKMGLKSRTETTIRYGSIVVIGSRPPY